MPEFYVYTTGMPLEEQPAPALVVAANANEAKRQFAAASGTNLLNLQAFLASEIEAQAVAARSDPQLRTLGLELVRVRLTYALQIAKTPGYQHLASAEAHELVRRAHDLLRDLLAAT